MADLVVEHWRVTPFLWYDGAAAEAARFYTSMFPNSRIEGDVVGAPAADGDVMSVAFWLDGQRLIAFNGGPQFPFTPAVSLFVRCETQAEVDYYWDSLVAGGEPSRCGWLRDKFGLSWQIVPAALAELLGSEDANAAERAMNAMLAMQKLDIAGLERAARGESGLPD